MSASVGGGGGDDVEVVAALTSVRRAAEIARGSMGELDVSARPEALSRRVTAAAAQLGVLRAAIAAPALRYQAVRPTALPDVPAHVPELLRTRKAAAMSAADRGAEALGAARASAAAAAAPNAPAAVPEHNALVARVVRAYEAEASAAVGRMRARNMAAMALVPST